MIVRRPRGISGNDLFSVIAEQAGRDKGQLGPLSNGAS